MSNYDSSTIVLILPIPPSLNNYYGHTAPTKHRVIKYIKPEGKTYREIVKKYIEENNFNIGANIPLKVEVILNFPTNRQQDLDNRMKSLLDSLTIANVWLDDSLIYDLHIIRGVIGKPGGVIVKISEYQE